MTPNARKPERKVLVLQGGGALGAYQGGAYEALMAGGQEPEWVAGISIGAINAAIIAGNPPQNRVAKLRQFWNLVSSHLTAEPLSSDETSRKLFNETSAALVASTGVPGFFSPRFPPAVFAAPGTDAAISVYDTSPLRETLTALVDFEYLNSGAVRLSIGAVQVRTGNMIYFDSATQRITPDHIMASGALPPGFPPITIDGEAYWDGGLVSNTPLQYVLDAPNRSDMVVFQIDLFNACGPMPQTLFDVARREMDIRYSSRTRLSTDMMKQLQTYRRAISRLERTLPAQFKDTADWKLVSTMGCDAAITIVHLIQRYDRASTKSMDYEFSRYSIDERWIAGAEDVKKTLAHPDWIGRQRPRDGVVVLDLTRVSAPPVAKAAE